MKKLLLLILGLTLAAPAVLIQTGCNSTQTTTAYKTLSAVGASVDQAMIIAANLKVQGKLTDAQAAAIEDAHYKYNLAYNGAIIIAGMDSSQPASDNLIAVASSLIALVAQYQK